MTRPGYKLVIFDWDGTLMNSEARIVASVQEAARRCGLPVLPHEQSKQIIGLSLDRAILTLYPEIEPGLVMEVAQAYTQHFLHESEVEMQPYEGARDLLHSLKEEGVLLAVATGKSRKGLDAVLEQSGFGEYFHITRTPVEAASKPNPLMLKQILNHLKVSVEDAVMVGDTTFDMQMAQSISMDRLALHHGVHSAQQLADFHPTAEFADLLDLHAWLLDGH